VPATVQLHGQFDSSLICSGLVFSQTSFLIQLSNAYLVIWARAVEEDGMHIWGDKVCKGWFPADVFPYVKAFVSTVKIKWW